MDRHLHISIVSHGHMNMILTALNAVLHSFGSTKIKVSVWLTLNIPEPKLIDAVRQQVWPFELHIIENEVAAGFGVNHNRAFFLAVATEKLFWFLVMNPDIVWNPEAAQKLDLLLFQSLSSSKFGLICPVQLNVAGELQDYARPLPTPFGLFKRTAMRKLRTHRPTSYITPSLFAVDWFNGACMIWRGDAYQALGGFDERYFMYCEDVDICLRARLAGFDIGTADFQVVHDSQRSTLANPQHFRWHLRSLIRLWLSKAFWQYWWMRRRG
jgi:N-acetylglucosaminyl-diphospho-decaprenol L-rhamnosyltransferase